MSNQTSKRPVIGIPAWSNSQTNFFGVAKDYVDFASQFGKVVILNLYDETVDGLDLLILPGGPDVNPLRYGHLPMFQCGTPNNLMEAFDLYHLPAYIEKGVPVFGICRGAQTLNVHFGGTLIQEIGAHAQSKDRDTEPAHKLSVVPKYSKAFSGCVINKVTSRHHQCIDELGEGIDVIAFADDKSASFKNIPEVIMHTELNVAGVQYHPESNVEDEENFTHRIINHLLNKTLQEWRKSLVEKSLFKQTV